MPRNIRTKVKSKSRVHARGTAGGDTTRLKLKTKLSKHKTLSKQERAEDRLARGDRIAAYGFGVPKRSPSQKAMKTRSAVRKSAAKITTKKKAAKGKRK
jgi:hypothetical protein